MPSGFTSAVLKDIIVLNNEELSKVTLNLPERWWTTTYTYDDNVDKKSPVIYPINNLRKEQRFTPIPRLSNWEIKNGDYMVKDKYIQFSDIKKRRKYIDKAVFVGFIVLAATFTMLLSKMFLLLP